MTDLQRVRKALLGQLNKLEEGNSKDSEVLNIVSVSNSIIKSYNTELRADELANVGKEEANKSLKNRVFDEPEMQ